MSQVYGPDFVPAPPATEAKRQAWAQAIHAENQLIGFTVHAVALPQLDPTQPDSRLLTKLAERLDEETAPAAMTRLARPSITVALLHESNGRMYLDADGRRPVDLSAKPDTATTRDILKRSVVLSHPEWVNYFKGRPSVPAWEASPQLKFVKPAILHGNSLQHGQYRLALDPELGVLLQRL
ncbi:MAG: hypothetical protein NZ585_14600 [Chloracidobacterium sp.]|nr:hypothetical protein [Chloracidobacterium sp.]